MCEPNKWGIPNLGFQSHSIAHSGDALYVQRSPHNADMNVWRRRAFLLLLLFCACAMSVLNVGLACNRFLHRGYRNTEICCCFLAQLIYFHPILLLLTPKHDLATDILIFYYIIAWACDEEHSSTTKQIINDCDLALLCFFYASYFFFGVEYLFIFFFNFIFCPDLIRNTEKWYSRAMPNR